MKPGMADSPLRQTIFEVYAPVERHLAARKARASAGAPPLAPLPSLDAYLMPLLAGMLDGDGDIAVLDLARAATGGASTVLWTTQGWGGRLFAPASIGEAAPGVEAFAKGPEGQELANLPARCRDATRPLLVCLATGADGPGETLDRLKAIHAANPRAVVLAFPLGLVGQDPGLAGLLDWARDAGLAVAPVRDLTPTLAVARLGVLYSAEDPAIPAALARIRRFFEGNFDALKLAALNFTLGFENGRLGAELKDAWARFGEADGKAYHLGLRVQGLEAEVHRLSEWSRHLEGPLQEAAQPQPQVPAGVGSARWLRTRLFPPQSFQERAGKSIVRLHRRLHRKLRGPHAPNHAHQTQESR